MGRNIKISREQYRMLHETDEDSFTYLGNSGFKPYDGYNDITADGKVDGETYSGERTTGDRFASMRTTDGWNRYRSYGNVTPATVRESSGADDFYDVGGFRSDELNTLADGNDKDNLVRIPYSIEAKLNVLLDSIRKMRLSPKQQGIILNKVIECLDYDAIPNQWKKELINDIK